MYFNRHEPRTVLTTKRHIFNFKKNKIYTEEKI